MLATATLATMVFTGCTRSGSQGAELSGEDSAVVHTNEKDGSASTGPEGGVAQGDVESLPEDFALEYTTRTAGVLPADEEFIRVEPDKSGGFLLTAGTVTYEGGARNFVASAKKKQTEERCLAFYNEARKAGFFRLKDKYEEMEFGGIATTVKITANGTTKSVHVYGARIKEFDLVVSAIQALSR